MKTYTIALLLGVLAITAGCTADGTVNIDNPLPSTGSDGDESANGRAVFGVTDAAADMKAVQEVTIVTDELRVHHTTQGWITVSEEEQTYNLLELEANAETQLLANAELPNGTYNQLRLDIQEVTVTDENNTHTATMPSDELKIQGMFSVEENSTSAITFDFIANESIHVTGEGTYIMAPVIQLEARKNATVSVNNNNRVMVQGGTVELDERVGMNANGDIGVGLKIADSAALDTDVLGNVQVQNTADASGNLDVTGGLT